MNSWLLASLLFVVLAALALVFSLAMYAKANNRWLASLFFYLAAGFALMAVPVFFVVGTSGSGR